MSNMQPIDGDQILREEFGATQAQAHHSLSDSTMAAQMQTRVQARYVMAMRNPRSMAQVRQSILADCRRTSFAKIAMYSKPVGGKPKEGLGIRFVEAALRAMRNMESETQVIHDDSRKRMLRVTVSDIESNNHYTAEAAIEKVVERKPHSVKSGTTVLGQRTNSYGQTVLLVPADEHALMPKEGALASKLQRNCGLRHIPRDIQDECIEEIRKTLASAVEQDPDAERKAIFDAFATINVMPRELEKYLGHSVEQVSTKELVDLRQIYSGIRQGAVSWVEVMEAAREGDTPEQNKLESGNGNGKKSRKEAAREHVRRQAAQPQEEEPPLDDREAYNREMMSQKIDDAIEQ